ncbi:CaiF/GrlA family transcriptional regulator [Salmonella enterica]|nr:CaiF/GrlA family transcriptional regulator [Salmonella enterica]
MRYGECPVKNKGNRKNETNSKITGKTVTGELRPTLTQSNHDTFRIPPGLEQYVGEPLYILVALWCQREQRWINRNELMQVFCLSERRASHQISYITRRKESICCRLRSIVPPGRHRPLHEVFVDSVTLSRDRLRTVQVKRTATGAMSGPHKLRVGNGDRDIWRWLLRRGCPGDSSQNE